jgi:DNA-binding HxlR family transcriptional regulator
MPDAGFTIYGTPDGYIAVTNDVRQAILEALEDKDRELPELAEVTDRAKSTLSSNHMPQLLDEGVVEENPHPSDGRRKIYSLTGERLGSSSVPVDELRSAVKDYVTTAPLGARLKVPTALGAIAAAPADADPAVVRAQAEALGRDCGRFLDRDGARRPAMRVAEFLEREGVAEALQLDLEAPALSLDPAPTVDGSHAGQALAGFVAGALSTEGGEPGVELGPSNPQRVLIRLVDPPENVR